MEDFIIKCYDSVIHKREDKKLEQSKMESPWVLINLNNVIYAVSCDTVFSLNQMPQITPLPLTPKEIRGVIDFRGRSIQLIDTRVMLGMSSINDDVENFKKIMHQRYEDHLNWINTLEETVKSDQEFTLTTDPHACAFGKWYDNYDSQNTNIMFLSTFSKFDKPHKEIHAIADKAKNLIKKNKKDEAIALIDSVKNTELKQMLNLFKDIETAYEDSRKEIVVVIGEEDSCIGLSVDRIEAIEPLTEFDEELIKESITSTEYLSGYAKRKDGSVAFILNDKYILSKFH